MPIYDYKQVVIPGDLAALGLGHCVANLVDIITNNVDPLKLWDASCKHENECYR